MKEAVKRRNEDARNDLEGYLYRVRDLLSDDGEHAPFVKCSQPIERDEISAKLEETLAWLNEEGDRAETTTLVEKHKALKYVYAASQARCLGLTKSPPRPQKAGGTRDPPIQRDRGVPASTKPVPDVELEHTPVPHRSPPEPNRRGRPKSPVAVQQRRARRARAKAKGARVLAERRRRTAKDDGL
jgi:hypothetical protein